MSSVMVQGQGDCTEWKQTGLGSVFYLNLKIAEHIPFYPYVHFDLNCGSGYNHEADCIGSPLAFLRAADELKNTNFAAYFVDKDREAVVTLGNMEEVSRRKNCSVVCMDNKEFVGTIPDKIFNSGNKRVRLAMGSVVCDPNGADIPFAELKNLFAFCERLDLIINWNSTAVKRCRGIGKNIPRVKDFPALFNKDNWLIREPLGAWQFTILIGRNYPIGDWKSLGFHSIDSDKGKMILDRIDQTEKERVVSSEHFRIEKMELQNSIQFTVPPTIQTRRLSITDKKMVIRRAMGNGMKGLPSCLVAKNLNVSKYLVDKVRTEGMVNETCQV